MIKQASAGNKGSSVPALSQFIGRKRLESNQWLVGNPTVPSQYKFIGSAINELPTNDRRKQLKINSSSESSPSIPLWKVVLNGSFVFAFLAFVFGVSGWMFYGLMLEFATLGDAQVLELVQRF